MNNALSKIFVGIISSIIYVRKTIIESVLVAETNKNADEILDIFWVEHRNKVSYILDKFSKKCLEDVLV